MQVCILCMRAIDSINRVFRGPSRMNRCVDSTTGSALRRSSERARKNWLGGTDSRELEILAVRDSSS